MTPLPKRRNSSQRSGKRQTKLLLAKTVLVKCPNCGQVKLSHTVCPNCGFYKEKGVLEIKQKKTETK